MRRFYVTMVKPDPEGYDWKVWSTRATMAYIAAQRVADAVEYQDRLPEFYKNQDEALYAAQQLAQRYAPAQVILHYKPTKPKESRWPVS